MAKVQTRSVLAAGAEEAVQRHGQNQQAAHGQLLIVAGHAHHVQAVVDNADDEAANDNLGNFATPPKNEAPPMITASMAYVS